MSDRRLNAGYEELTGYDARVVVHVRDGICVVDGGFTSAELRRLADEMDRVTAEVRPTLCGFPVRTVKDDPILKELGQPLFGEMVDEPKGDDDD